MIVDAQIADHSGDVDSINHVGFAVRDIAESAASFERLGFTLSPLSMHTGAAKPGAPAEALGTGNMCIIFERNYLELLAYVDPSLPDLGVEESLERFAGAHYLITGCGSAQVVDRRLQRNGIWSSGVMPLQREIDTPEGTEIARFERVLFDEGHDSEGEVQAAYHATPTLIHQPRYMGHSNGAIGILEVVITSDDPKKRAHEHARYYGVDAHQDGPLWTVPLATGQRISVCAPQDIESAYGINGLPPTPAICGIRIETSNLEAAAAIWSDRGVPTTSFGNALVIQREHASGSALIFEQSGRSNAK